MHSSSEGAATPQVDSAIRPRKLRPGSRIALVAPAGPVDSDRIHTAEQRCRILGFEPVLGARAHARQGFLAGSDADRLADLQAAFDDPNIDGVWALRGGWGTARIVDDLDLARQRSDPIPFIGFSDNTALHARMAAIGVVSFHGPHPTLDGSTTLDAWFRRVVGDASPPGPLPFRKPSARATLSEGRARGRLAGGNLSILASLCGTPDQLLARGSILLLEDIQEPPYRIDRMLVQLRRAGALEGVRGLAFGAFTGGTRSDATQVEQILRRLAERLEVPAVAGLPFGHISRNAILPLGVAATLDANQRSLTLDEPAVR